MTLFKVVGIAIMILCGAAGATYGQVAQCEDYQQRVTSALSAAKRSADQLNAQQKSLSDAINQADDPQQAQRVLDGVINSTTSALDVFSENGEIMRSVSGLLANIDDRRKNAEQQAGRDPRWIARVDSWKAHGDNMRQLRQQILKEADRARGFLDQLKKDRTFIEDMIAGEGVARARGEMEVALKNLRELGDSLSEAVKVAEERNRKISAPAY